MRAVALSHRLATSIVHARREPNVQSSAEPPVAQTLEAAVALVVESATTQRSPAEADMETVALTEAEELRLVSTDQNLGTGLWVVPTEVG